MTKLVFSADETQSMAIDNPRFYLRPYIPEEGIVLLYGKYGTYKTPITLNIAKAIALGLPLWGVSTRQATPVLYVQADTPTNIIVPRIKKLNVDGTQIDFAFVYPGFDCLNPIGDWDQEVYKTLVAAHNKRGYKVVFIDALRCIHTMQDKHSEVPQQVYRKCAQMFADAVVILIHHDRKTTADETPGMQDESFSGSQAWINHATVGLKVGHHNKERHEILLTNTKSQADELGPPLTLKVEGGSIVRLKSEMDKAEAAAALATLSPGLSLRDQDKAIADALGVSERTARARRLGQT